MVSYASLRCLLHNLGLIGEEIETQCDKWCRHNHTVSHDISCPKTSDSQQGNGPERLEHIGPHGIAKDSHEVTLHRRGLVVKTCLSGPGIIHTHALPPLYDLYPFLFPGSSLNLSGIIISSHMISLKETTFTPSLYSSFRSLT